MASPIPAPTVTLTVSVVVPALLVAVRIYVVVVVGDTVVDVPVTVPIPWLMEILVASVTTQLSVELPPSVMLEGSAVKELMVGGLVPGVTPPQLEMKNNNKQNVNNFKIVLLFFTILTILIDLSFKNY